MVDSIISVTIANLFIRGSITCSSNFRTILYRLPSVYLAPRMRRSTTSVLYIFNRIVTHHRVESSGSISNLKIIFRGIFSVNSIIIMSAADCNLFIIITFSSKGRLSFNPLALGIYFIGNVRFATFYFISSLFVPVSSLFVSVSLLFAPFLHFLFRFVTFCILGGPVPPSYVLFCGTVPPNSFSQNQ